jgi:hypothetical protein
MATPWSPEDLAIIVDIWSRPQSIEKQMHRLPDRTIKAAKNQAHRLGLVKVVGENKERMCDKALSIIEKDGPMSVDYLAKVMCRSRQTADSILLQLREEGLIHIAGFAVVKRKRNWNVKLWGAGAGQNFTRLSKPVIQAQVERPAAVRTFPVPQRDALTAAFFGEAHG